jgi:hypothetical protein
MYRIDDPSAATSLPVPEVAGAEGFWTEGNPVAGVAATLERASWFNMVQEELRAIAVTGGQTPSKTSYNQILLALQAMFGAGRVGHAYTANDWVPLPGGLIVQWGQFLQSDNGTPVAYNVVVPIAFPNGALQAFLTPGNAVPNSGCGTVEFFSKTALSGFTNANTASRTWRFLVIGY